MIEFPNGDIYQGDIVDEQMQGHGVLYKESERKLYVGTFDHGNRNYTFYVTDNVIPFFHNNDFSKVYFD